MAAAGRIAGPVTIKIRGGEYFLNEPLVFESRDSGSEKAPITYGFERWHANTRLAPPRSGIAGAPGRRKREDLGGQHSKGMGS